MATAAFKSTTKRSSINSSSSTKDVESDYRHRRSRSLSRFSGPYNNEIEDEFLVPKKNPKFVNTERGSAGFPEISLDDLVTEFFPSENHDRGRSSLRRSSSSSGGGNSVSGEVITRRGRFVSRQRGQASVHDSNLGAGSGYSNSRGGRSVSRQHATTGDVKIIQETSSGSKGVANFRRRSASVTKYQFSDSESDKSINSKNHTNLKSSRIVNDQRSSILMPTAKTNQRVLRRSLSQIDLSRSHDGYSSHSSSLTDDESQDARSSRNGTERTIRAVYAQNKVDHPVGDGGEIGMYEVMRKELRSVVQEMRTELEEVMVKTKPSDSTQSDNVQLNNANVLQAISVIRDSYATRLEQSEKRKHHLLAEIVVEEQRGRELSKIVKDLLPDANNADVPQKLARARKRSNDRSRMSKCLTEEAEKYFEGFISNVEDTDISSLDGERSDAGSKIGGRAKPRDYTVHFEAETRVPSAKLTSLPNDDMDGVVLPWLEWETTNDVSPVVCKSTSKVPLTPGNNFHDTAQELVQEMSTGFNNISCFFSSRGSWSPGGDSLSELSKDAVNIMNGEVDSKPKESWFDMDEYHHLQREESRFIENWRQRERIRSGGLLLCNSKYF